MLIHLKSVNALEAKTIKYKILMDLFRINLHGVDKVSMNVLKKIELIERLAMIGTRLFDICLNQLNLAVMICLICELHSEFKMNNRTVTLP